MSLVNTKAIDSLHFYRSGSVTFGWNFVSSIFRFFMLCVVKMDWPRLGIRTIFKRFTVSMLDFRVLNSWPKSLLFLTCSKRKTRYLRDSFFEYFLNHLRVKCVPRDFLIYYLEISWWTAHGCWNHLEPCVLQAYDVLKMRLKMHKMAFKKWPKMAPKLRNKVENAFQQNSWRSPMAQIGPKNLFEKIWQGMVENLIWPKLLLKDSLLGSYTNPKGPDRPK